MFKRTKNVIAIGLLLVASSTTAIAGPLTDRANAGEPIRIGFANIPAYAYPGKNGEPEGFANVIAISTLAKMGYHNIEPVVTDWGGLIPGLKARRYDLITGGMYILNSRCQNIAFSEPIGKFGDALLVPKGNPKNINNYQDIIDQGAKLVTGAGYNTIEAAKKVGVKHSQILQVPGPTEILASMMAGRADAGGLTYFEAANLAEKSNGVLEVTDPADLPDWTKNWSGIGFREEDSDFMARFNAAMSDYIGSEEMLAAVAEYGYTMSHLPGDVTTEWICENR